MVNEKETLWAMIHTADVLQELILAYNGMSKTDGTAHTLKGKYLETHYDLVNFKDHIFKEIAAVEAKKRCDQDSAQS